MTDHAAERDVTIPVPRPATVRDAHRLARRAGLAALGLATIVAGGVYARQWWAVGRFLQTTDDAYVGADVTQIAPHVGGFVKQILIADNQYVRAGDMLIRLDPNDFAAGLNNAAAVLQSRQATLASLQAKRTAQNAVIAAAAADLLAKRAQALFASQEADRYHVLAQTAGGTRQNEQRTAAAGQSANAAVLGAQATLDAAQQQSEVLDAQIAAAKADIAQAQAELQIAQLNVGYTSITAPISGYVGNRSAEVGAYVATGTDLLSVVPAQGLWVDANFKEDELASMAPGQAATIVADILPGRTFRGRVASVAPATGAIFSVIPPQNATGNFTKIVQRVPVRIALDGDEQDLGLLRAGLSVTVTVDTRAREPAVK